MNKKKTKHIVSMLILADMYDVLSKYIHDCGPRNEIADELAERIRDYPEEYFSGDDEPETRQQEYE